MKDPIRWRMSNGEADAETRALLDAASVEGPSQDEADGIWASLSAHLDVSFGAPGPGAGPPLAAPHVGTAATAAAAAGAAGTLAGKITVAVVVLASVGGAVGVHTVVSRARHDRSHPQRAVATNHLAPPPASPSSVPSLQPAAVTADPAAVPKVAESPLELARPPVPPARRPVVGLASDNRPQPARPMRLQPAYPSSRAAPALSPPVPIVEDRPSTPTVEPPAPAPAPAAAVPSAVPPSEPPLPVNLLLEEGRRLDRARLALRSHDPDLALRLLSSAPLQTPMLAQEHEALTIEAMAAKPALRAQAAARARVFLRDYPTSPYRARVRALLADGL